MPYADHKNTSGGYKTAPGTTSHAAAERIAPVAGTIREKVLACLRTGGPLTTDQIAARINHPYVSVQPRVSELKADGKVEDSGQRRIGQWGVANIVWKIVKAGGE
jgi:hypothetical protein